MPNSPRHPVHLAVDGSAANGCTNLTSSCSTILSTNNGNDVIIAFATEILDQQTSCIFAISDTAGLHWQARSNIAFGGGGRAQLQEFWALGPSTPLSSDVLTESISGCGTNYNNIMTFGISGGNTASPFDPNTSLPIAASGFGGNTSVNVSTTNPHDIIYAAELHGNFPPLPTAGPGFKIITPAGTNAIEYDIINSPVSNLAVTFRDGAIGDWISIGDAVQPSR